VLPIPKLELITDNMNDRNMSDRKIHESYTIMKKIELLSTLLTKPGTEKIEAMRNNKVGLGCTVTRILGLFVETNVSTHHVISR
jgi:hypothetical protein